MSTDDRPPGRGVMRSWLKSTLESGVLETMRASEATGGNEPESFARNLLARLREADGGLRPDDPLAVAFREFRRSVESERRSRRLGMLGPPAHRRRIRETRPGESPTPPDDPKAAKTTTVGKASSGWRLSLVRRWVLRIRWAVASRTRARPTDLANPLWDRWLDG